MATPNVLVRAMNYLEILDFLKNGVLRNTKYRVRRVIATDSVNLYRVQLETRKTIFSKEIRFCDFKAYDSYFEFEEFNEDGKLNSWWLCFLLVRCISYVKTYLPKGESVEGYTYKVQEFLKENNIVFLHNWRFFEMTSFANKESEQFVDLQSTIELADAKRKLEYGENIYISGYCVGARRYWPKELFFREKIVSIDFPMVTDKNGRKYILKPKA